MSVKHYLDCGCAIMDDGRRELCPTCIGGGSGPRGSARDTMHPGATEPTAIVHGSPLGTVAYRGDPPFTAEHAKLFAAALDMLNALSATRAYLWGELCNLNLATGANHPTAHLYLQVEAAIEAATLGPEPRAPERKKT